MTVGKTRHGGSRVQTGIRNLDSILRGGIPKGSLCVVGGPPGSGKTILSQQICFHNASPESPALYFNTLSEPTAKTLRCLREFSFADPDKLERSVRFVDLGKLLREKGLESAASLMMEEVRRTQPGLVVIDSFKVFNDLSKAPEELRKFGYEIAVNLMAWEVTALLLGEYGRVDYELNPVFSITDGLWLLSHREASGEQQRFLQIVKMRGTGHSMDEHSFMIGSDGIDVYAPRVTIRRLPRSAVTTDGTVERLQTGISNLDKLLGEGIPLGSSILVSGVAGTGKTMLLLEFVYRGALAGEKGILFSFEETEERLRAAARGLGWNLDAEIERGMVELVFIPQPDIMLEKHLLMIHEKLNESNARRVAVDSVSVFLHKVKDPQINREKIFQLATIVHNTHSVGLFSADVPSGSNQISRFGVEETVVDGVILLTAIVEGLHRHRYIEVYKLRNTDHVRGRHGLQLGGEGITVYPRHDIHVDLDAAPASLETHRRLGTGVPGLDALMGGGVLARSATLVSGSAGIGKSTMAMQFVLEGARQGEKGLYISLEEGPHQLAGAAETLELPLKKAMEAGSVHMLYLSRSQVRGAVFPNIVIAALERCGATRLVLDGVGQLLQDEPGHEDLRQLVYALLLMCKRLGVTTWLTLETRSLHAGESVTDQGLSPVADNLIMMRYLDFARGLRPSILVVKTRGSEHAWDAHTLRLGKGGLTVDSVVEVATSGARAPPKAKPKAKPIHRRSRK
jgi:circadian clock protein KaiC